MALADQIDQDLAAALKAGENERLSVLRLIKTALKYQQIQSGQELSDADVMKVLQREAKQRRDSIKQYTDGGREDLAQDEQRELAIIEQYLPQQMSQDELAKIVDRAVTETGASGPAQMGVVIGTVMKEVAGRADGAAVSALVKQRLT